MTSAAAVVSGYRVMTPWNASRRGVGNVRREREGNRLGAVVVALDPGLRCIELRGIDEQNEIPVERRIALRQRDRRALAVHGNGHRV